MLSFYEGSIILCTIFTDFTPYLDLFLQGDKVTAAQSGNKALAVRLSEWAFGERGRLRVRNVNHNRQGEKKSSNTYTITDTVVSMLTIFSLRARVNRHLLSTLAKIK